MAAAPTASYLPETRTAIHSRGPAVAPPGIHSMTATSRSAPTRSAEKNPGRSIGRMPEKVSGKVAALLPVPREEHEAAIPGRHNSQRDRRGHGLERDMADTVLVKLEQIRGKTAR